MFSLRVSVVALLAIALIARFDQGAALKCHTCESVTNKDCLEAPEKTDLIDCGGTNPATTPATTPTTAPTTAPTTTPATTPTTAVPAGNDGAQKTLEAVQTPRAEPEMACIKTVVSGGTVNVVARGCMAKGICASLSEATSGLKCYECDDKDGCNASSRISLGIMSILIPVGLVAIFSR